MGNEVQPVPLFDVKQRCISFEEEFVELFPVCCTEEQHHVPVAQGCACWGCRPHV